jgi:hypothetical protein
MKSKVTFAAGVDSSVVSQSVLDLAVEVATASKNPAVVATSTLRPPERQALAMYTNEENGNNISYATPGKAVIDVYKQAKKEKKTRDETLTLMTAKIVELANTGQLVSRHCVSEEQYAKENIIDWSKQTVNLPNPRDFVREWIKKDKCTRVITPIGDKATYGNSSKVSIDPKEPAIHVQVLS